MSDYSGVLTIAMPVYERYVFFEEAVQTVLNQTVKCKVIVIDNHSSHNKFESYCKLNNISYFRNDKNYGMFYNWNKCFEYSDTPYVMIFGDDDKLADDYVERFRDAIEKYGPVDVYYTDFVLLNNEDNTTNTSRPSFTVPFGYSKSGQEIIDYASRFGLGFPTISCIIKKDVFHGYYEKYHASNDWLWLYENIGGLSVYGLDKVKATYRKHEMADTLNNETAARCILAHAYILETLIASKASTPGLRRRAKLAAFKKILDFKLSYGKYFNTCINEKDNIYSIYLNKKINIDQTSRIILSQNKLFLKALRKIMNVSV